MSKFGFNEIIQKIPSVEKQWLKEGIKIAQEEFKNNFETESDTETGKEWNDVVRKTPPPILVETGEMKSQATEGKPEIIGNKATLTIDPIDERGRGYAEYHQEGINQYRSKEEFQRPFITESKETDLKLKNELVKILDKEFL